MFNKLRKVFSSNGTPSDEPSFVAVGFPKVGNTWLRVTLGRYLQSRYGLATTPLMDVAEVSELKSRGVSATGNFTHHPLEWDGQTASDLTVENVVGPFAGKRVLLLCRHPLDALVSLYMHQKYMNPAKPYEGGVVDLIDDPAFGLDKFIRFYNLWHDNLNSAKAVKLWRFEDAKAEPGPVLTSVLTFLGEKPDPAVVDEAVAFGSFDNMRSLERGNEPLRYKSSGFSIFATGDAANPNAHHVRRGEVGGWRDEIPQSEHERYLDQIRSDLRPFFGYGV